MRINKLLPLLLFLLLAVPFAAHADHPIDHSPKSAEEYRHLDMIAESADLRAAGGLTASVDWVQGDYFTPTTWHVSVQGGTAPYVYYYELHRVDENLGGYEIITYRGDSENDTFTETLVASGTYELRVWIDDSAGGYTYTKFTFYAHDEAHPTMETAVAELASECAAAGCVSDFDRAVWLHDWLTMHAKYDLTYTYYGADAVLLRHTGVCDSYAKCYQLLLMASGVESQYVYGTTGKDSHAWNAIRFDGHWYWVDTTWDDPTGVDEIVSGYERHIYFGLPDEIFLYDHTPEDCDLRCDSYDYNYHIYTGDTDLWTGDFISAINDSLAQGCYRTQTAVPDSYIVEKEDGYWRYPKINDMLPFGLAAEALRRMSWSVDGAEVRLNVEYTPTLLTAEIDFTGRELLLPGNATEIGESAFEGDAGFMSVTLGPDVQSIGPGAFAGASSLWRVVVPNASAQIDGDAFDGSAHLTLVGPAGGSAETFANTHGYHFIAE